jgi:hypothetical protein
LIFEAVNQNPLRDPRHAELALKPPPKRQAAADRADRERQGIPALSEQLMGALKKTAS